MSTTKDRLNAVQEIINILEKFDSTDREKILQYVNGESNIQSNKEEQFMLNIAEHMEPLTGIMAILFNVFKESIKQTDEDKRHFLEEIKTTNEIAEAMGDYLKGLTDAAAPKKKKQNPKMIESLDTSEAVFIILMNTFMENNEYLEDLVKRIQEQNEAKDFMHEHLRGLREAQADLACSNEKKVKVKLCLFRMSDDCIENDEQSTDVIITKENLNFEISNLEFLLDKTRNKQKETTERLEYTMDRRSKFISTLSNIMKKISTTQDTLVSNIK